MSRSVPTRSQGDAGGHPDRVRGPPPDAGQAAHASLGSGFAVLGFGELDEPDMAYVVHALGAAHIEGESDVAQARRKFDQLRTLALGPADSLALLRGIAAT